METIYAPSIIEDASQPRRLDLIESALTYKTVIHSQTQRWHTKSEDKDYLSNYSMTISVEIEYLQLQQQREWLAWCGLDKTVKVQGKYTIQASGTWAHAAFEKKLDYSKNELNDKIKRLKENNLRDTLDRLEQAVQKNSPKQVTPAVETDRALLEKALYTQYIASYDQLTENQQEICARLQIELGPQNGLGTGLEAEAEQPQAKKGRNSQKTKAR